MKDRREREDIERRLDALREAHRELDERIERLVWEGGVDDLELKRLKKQKLALKDRIAALEQALARSPLAPGLGG